MSYDDDSEAKPWDDTEGFAFFGVYFKCPRRVYNEMSARIFSSAAYIEYCELGDMIEQGTWPCDKPGVMVTLQELVKKKTKLDGTIRRMVAAEVAKLEAS